MGGILSDRREPCQSIERNPERSGVKKSFLILTDMKSFVV